MDDTLIFVLAFYFSLLALSILAFAYYKLHLDYKWERKWRKHFEKDHYIDWEQIQT